MMDNFWILAQANGDAPTSIPSSPVTSEGEGDGQAITTEPDPGSMEQQQTDQPVRNPYLQFLPFVFLLVVMYLILFRGPRKKQQQHKQMMQELSKSDKVQTIGGIIGTVVDIKDDEVTIKIDESNNTKMKILRSAISRNLSKD